MVATSKPAQPPERNYAFIAVLKQIKIPEKPWTKLCYKIHKPKEKMSSLTTSQEQLKQRILFLRNPGLEKSEADLILALNKALQQVGVKTYIWFSQVRYAPSDAISAFLTKKADA